jgi:predicted acylesterase/phospholipase RssA
MARKPLRLSLTLSGGASLGAFEAGAAAALITAWRNLRLEHDADASIDAIGGASAGAIVGLFSAHCVLSGADPVALLREAWVEKVSLSLLRGKTADAPLSFADLREDLPELFDDHPPEPKRAQDRPLALQISLTGLRGLAYPIHGKMRSEPIRGVSYADWGRFELQPGGDTDQLLKPEGASALDFVLASASSPGGFAPALVDRSSDSDAYSKRGIEEFPDDGRLWYTDGGLVASQPIGRTFAAGRMLHGQEPDAQHLNLLIDPRSEVSAGNEPWSDPESELSWQSGTSRALAILSQQDLFEDLRRIEKDNSRLGWIDDFVAELSPQLKQGSEEKLRGFIEGVRSELAEVRSDEPELGEGDDDLSEMGTQDLLRRALLETAGLAGKQVLTLDVISPLILADDNDPKTLLAGEFMGDFGGFLSEELRSSDFTLGYDAAAKWLEQGLPECELSEAAVDETLGAVREAAPPGEAGKRGEAEAGDLSLRDRAQIVRLAAHTARVAGSGWLDLRSRIPDPIGKFLKRGRD